MSSKNAVMESLSGCIIPVLPFRPATARGSSGTAVLAELRRFEHFWEAKYLSLLDPTPEGRHLYGAIDVKRKFAFVSPYSDRTVEGQSFSLQGDLVSAAIPRGASRRARA